MKNKKVIIFIALCLLILLNLMFFLLNPTFLKTHYSNNGVKIPVPKNSLFISKTKNDLKYPVECCNSSIVLSSIKSKKYLDNYIKDYIENLPSCYDESYFYDKNNNVTFSRYTATAHGIYNKLDITFQKGNYCKNQYVLEENWLDIVGNSKVSDSTINYEELIKLFGQSNREKLDGFVPFDDKYQVNYLYNNYGYTIYFIPYSTNVIGVIKVDSNESKKYAIYDIKKDSEAFLNSLLK